MQKNCFSFFMMIFILLSLNVTESMERDKNEIANKEKLSQEQMRMSRPIPPAKLSKNLNFLNNTNFQELFKHSPREKEKVLRGFLKIPELDTKRVQEIVEYCSKPNKILSQLGESSFEKNCSLWVAADFLQPRESKINENNNNEIKVEENKNLFFLKKQIEHAIAKQLSENISDESIEAIAESHLPPALEDNLKANLNRTIQSCTGKLTLTPICASILPLKAHLSAKGNFVFSTKTDVSEIGIYTVQGKELGHCLGYRDNPPISISGNEQYYAFATDNKTITIFELPGLNKVDAINVNDAEAIEFLKIGHNGNYVALVESLSGVLNKLYVHDVRLKKTFSIPLGSKITAIELSDDEKYLGVIYSRTGIDDRLIWLLDRKAISESLDQRTGAIAFHPTKKLYATWRVNGGVYLKDFDGAMKLFEMEENSSCTLSFDPSGDYLIAQGCAENPDTTKPDKSTVSIFSVPLNKMIKDAISCDTDSPVSIIGDSVLVKDNKTLIAHSLTTNQTRTVHDYCNSIVVSKDGTVAVIEDHFNFYATKLQQELPTNLKLYEILQFIKNENEKPGSGAELLKKIEAYEQSKNQNSEKKDVSESQRTVKYSRPHYPPKPPQEKYIPSSFDTHLDNAGNEKGSGKDEEKDNELS